MSALGVMNNSYYNSIHVLPASQGVSGPTGTGTIPATELVGALEVDLSVGNGAATAQTYTTDTAVNILAALQNAVSAAYKANVGGFASSLSEQPAIVWPNFFNTSWTVTICNQGTTAASTLAGGTGVTIAAIDAGYTSGTGNLGTAAAANTPSVTRWVVTVTSAQTVTMTRVQ